MNSSAKSDKLILAIVGMAGSGKSEAAKFFQEKGFPSVRFGQITDEGIKNQGLEITAQNEKVFRENLRKELGMEAYAIKTKPLIDEMVLTNNLLVLDGLYSWEEYLYLKKFYSNLKLIHIFAERDIRYKRLSKRKIRPLSIEECYKRDVAEIEKLNKGGPIAMADYLIENNSGSKKDLYRKLDNFLKRFEVFK